MFLEEGAVDHEGEAEVGLLAEDAGGLLVDRG